mmetsp:Transcript_7413/g.16200  ORF Transcript_7413/g.16200 Transcript_7413/m.16200 type:complete len:771 (+) Transcript_7413:321-2633(+)
MVRRIGLPSSLRRSRSSQRDHHGIGTSIGIGGRSKQGGGGDGQTTTTPSSSPSATPTKPAAATKAASSSSSPTPDPAELSSSQSSSNGNTLTNEYQIPWEVTYDHTDGTAATASASSASAAAAAVVDEANLARRVRSIPSPQYDNDVDPYSDVRERLEQSSLRDKLRFVYHRSQSASDHGAGVQTHTQMKMQVKKQVKKRQVKKKQKQQHDHNHIPFFAAITTYLGYAVLIFIGHVRDVCASIFRQGRYYRSAVSSAADDDATASTACSDNAASTSDENDDGSSGSSKTVNNHTIPSGPYPSDNPATYAPLLKSWENFYTRRLYHRIQDCFNRPIASRPGATIRVLERVSWDGNKTMKVLGRLDNLETWEQREEYTKGQHFVLCQPEDRVSRSCLNLGSYNYLGFADDWDVTCRRGVVSSLTNLPISTSSCRVEYGTTTLHQQVERIVSRFLGKDDAMILNMGFNTNATTIPALMGRGDLLVSDELNHTSIVNGARASGASIRTFRHNDADHLEEILSTAIVMGRPRTRRPWNKIMVIVEGIYSMEGEYCDLRNVVRVCKKYGAYLYLDEAHSIGAMGPTGRGCCEYTGVDPADVDVLMGTFTKSFGGMGGYVAGSREVIDYLRTKCAGSSFHNSLSPVVCQQIISSFKVIMGEDGTDIGKRKLTALRDNSNYFRMRLMDMGLHVLGHFDSPIVPVMLYNPTKIAAFSRECLKRGLAVVVVGFPAVPILMSRARFCISAAHTREDLDRALVEIEEIASLLKLKYNKSTFG